MNPLGVTVVGFPCNQFGKQEPGRSHEILPALKWEMFFSKCKSYNSLWRKPLEQGWGCGGFRIQENPRADLILSVNVASFNQRQHPWVVRSCSVCGPSGNTENCLRFHQSSFRLVHGIAFERNWPHPPGGRAAGGTFTDKLTSLWIPGMLDQATDLFQTSCCLKRGMWMERTSKRFSLSSRYIPSSFRSVLTRKWHLNHTVYNQCTCVHDQWSL